jgi:hypothetical protein
MTRSGESQTYPWVDATQHAVVITDEVGRVVAVSGAFRGLFGVARSSYWASRWNS